MRKISLTQIIAIGAITLASCIPVYAAQFTSAEYLEWKSDSQIFYLDTTVGTAVAIAGQNDKSHAKCLENWYFADQNNARTSILNAMTANKTYHPRLIILGILQKHCGTFKYKN